MNADLPHAPDDHPSVKFGRTGVLIANLGTPDATDYWSMRRYLGEFLSDRRVIDYPRWKWQPILQLIILSSRPFTSGKAYRSIWNMEANESPMLTITRNQAHRLEERTRDQFGDAVEVDFCMRYGNPSTASRLEALVAKGCKRILFMPLYPQYSDSTTATANDELFRCLMRMRWQPTIRTVAPYFENPLYIDALANSIESHLEALDYQPDMIVASYHGLPKRYLAQGDPYHCQCRKTSRLLMERLGWTEGLTTSFQSRFGPEEWLQPYTVEEVARLAENGHRRIAVLAPGFSADCIETLEEINEEIQEAFIEAGGEQFTYIPCLNADPHHIDLLFDIVRSNLSGWVD